MTDEGADALKADGAGDAGAGVEPSPPSGTAADTAGDGEDAAAGEVGEVGEAVVAAPVPSGRGWLTPQLILSALVAALLIGAGFLGFQVWSEHQLDRAAEDAQRTAVNYAQILTSIDSEKVDDNFQQVLDGATGEFKDMYSASSGELRQLLVENKATARGVVIDSAVQSIAKDKAVVLLFVDQSVSNTKLPDPRIDRSRMKMTLEYADGRWRASKVELP